MVKIKYYRWKNFQFWKNIWIFCQEINLWGYGYQYLSCDTEAWRHCHSIWAVLVLILVYVFVQLKKPSHSSQGVPTAINCLATLLKEPLVRSSFVQADGVKFLIPLIIPASSQQSIQVIQIQYKNGKASTLQIQIKLVLNNHICCMHVKLDWIL